MRLHEALASGRKFTRPSLVDDIGYISGTEIDDNEVLLVTEDLMADDYILEVDVGVTFTKAALATAWDEVAIEFASVKGSATSPLFAKLSARLFR